MSGTRKQERTWEYLRATGRPSLLRPDTPEVRWALRKIRSYNARGMSLSQMADQVDLAQDAITRLFREPGRCIRRSTFEKIRAIEFGEGEGQRAQVPLLGAQRRLQALRADGFPYGFLCEELGYKKTYPGLQRILTGSRKADGSLRVEFIIASTARRIERLYDKLAGVSPADLGVSEFAAKYSRSRASQLGYAPSGCWDADTIDDPDALPQWTGRCGSAFGWIVHQREGIPLCLACTCSAEDFVLNGSKLRALRERSGLSQARLAQTADVKLDAYRTWESGRNAPRFLGQVDRVLSVLDATFEEVNQWPEDSANLRTVPRFGRCPVRRTS